MYVEHVPDTERFKVSFTTYEPPKRRGGTLYQLGRNQLEFLLPDTDMEAGDADEEDA